ncbi:MAG: peptidylprolyl isomerase [PVC group bacterium]
MKKKLYVGVMVLLAGGWLFGGCGEKEKEAAPPAPETGQVRVDTAAPDAMVTTVNGVEVKGALFNQQLNALLQQYSRQIPPEQLSKMQPMLRQQAVAALVNQQLMMQEAEREEIMPDDQEVDAEIEKIVKQFPGREELDAQLKRAGVTLEDLRKDITRNLKIQMLAEQQFSSGTEATEEEITTFYNDNQEQFQQPEQVAASHILIKFAPDDTDEAKAEKREQLAALQKQVAEGADFAALAEANSQDTGSAQQGGSLGYFGRGMMIKPFEDTAFALQSGGVSEIVETQFGYHLIKVTGKKDAGIVPLEEVKEQVGIFLVNQKKQQTIGDFLQKLRDAATIEYGQGFQPVPPPTAGQFPPPQPPE